MIIFNKTNQIQELTVLDRSNPSYPYSIYICAKSTTELGNDIIAPTLKSLVEQGVFCILGVDTSKVETEIIEETVEDTGVSEDTVESDEILEETLEDAVKDIETPDTDEEEISDLDESVTQEDESPYICEICGKEYASKRSLNMHINKSHSN